MTTLAIPVARAIRKLGTDINKARRRRRITLKLMAERAGMSPTTLSKIEKGDPTASMKNYAMAIFVLGMLGRFEDLIDHNQDSVARMIDEENLPKRVRNTNRSKV